MAERPAPTKQDLLDALVRTRDDVIARVEALDAAALDRGVYENGWTAKQILAHVASIEWTYPRLIDMASGNPAASAQKGDPAAAPATSAPPAAAATSGSEQPSILDYNERQVAKRAEASTAELLDEFARNRAALIAAVEGADDETLAKQIRSAGGIEGPLVSALRLLAVDHVRGHLRDLTGATETA